MPAYAYNAVDAAGKRTKGRAEAETTNALARALEQRGLLLVEAKAAEPEEGGGSFFKFGDRKDVLEVTRAMGALLPAGMPLTQALSAASNVVTGDIQETIAKVRARVERGDMLADALTEHPRYFPAMYVGMVRAGERSGDLDGAFKRLAETLERDQELRGKLLSASIYPLLLASVGSVAVTVLLVFVLPKFVELLEGGDAVLPPTTRALLNFSAVLRQFWPALFLIPIAIGGVATWIRKSEQGMRLWCGTLLRIPIVSSLRRYSLSARFARVTSVLLTGGAPLLAALEDAVESVSDPLAKDDINRIRARVREGSSLRAAISEGDLFPPLLAQLISVGEESGRLRDFLSKAADIFEDKTERAMQRMATLAEPAMIVFFGAIVAFVALSLLQAIYGVNQDAFR